MATYLDQLTPSTDYTVRARVIENPRKNKPLPNGWTHQTFVIQDENGHNMKGRLIGAQVETYRDILVYRGDYEISNAPITYCPEHCKSHYGQLDHVMGIGERTSIRSMPGHIGTPYPEYMCLAQIPSSPKIGVRYDVLGVLLYADQEPRKKRTETKYRFAEKDIIIIDSSVEAPLKVVLSGDLSEIAFQENKDSPFKFTVVGLTALRAYPKKDLQLSSSISTEVITRPRCSEAAALENWAAAHTEELTRMRTSILAGKKQVQGCLSL